MGAGDARYPTSEYYGRLRGLLGFPGDDYIESFEFIHPLFERFADWLVDDIAGARGRLILPAEPHPRLVGLAVSQTVFRARDRQVLFRFFSERLGGSIEGFDPLRRLQRWSGRGQLTQHALRLLKNDEFADQVRAALWSAFRSWDGAELVETDTGVGRVWPAFVRLLIYPQPRLQIGAGNTRPLDVRVGETPHVVEPGREISLPWSLVADARGRPLVLGDPRAAGGALRIPRLGETIMFERSEDGLLRVEQPGAERTWLLTSDTELQGRLRRYRFNDGGTVPDGWALYFDVPSLQLPKVEGAVGPRVQAPLRVEGGLSLGRPRYLSGYPPILAAGDLDTEERLSIVINGVSHGFIGSGERIGLPAEPGRYEVVVGDGEFRTSYDAEERGQPTDLVLRHELGKEGALRSGARLASQNGAGATVCGATVSVPYSGLLPLLTRVAGDLETIDAMGELRSHRHVPPPRWLAEVGLEHGRWEIFCQDPVWLLHRNARTSRAWARLLADRELTALSAGAARRVRDLASAVVVHGRGFEKATVQQRWQQLLLLALRRVDMDGYQREVSE
jgi:hypothetical protein